MPAWLKKTLTVVVGVFVAPFIALAIYVNLPESEAEKRERADEEITTPKPRQPSQGELATSAKGACMLAIKQMLHDSGSAEFPPGATAHKSDGEIWIVRRTVRAKNAFGAYRLAEFECQMLKVESGWLPLEIKQITE